ncbi:MAG TPA: amino acid adenylation domain-containing protein, partial [Steroidobacteraceae bacterium]
ADTASLVWDGMEVLVAQERTNYPITVDVDDLGQGFILTARCVVAVDPARMAAYLRTALDSVVDRLARDSRQPLLSSSILGAPERQQLLVEWNATATRYPSGQLVHQLFEAQAAANPGAEAIIYQDQSLTYGELNAKANQLAHYLLSLGIRPDDRIAVYADRSLDMVVGLLGILKAGGAYVPLDPDYPEARRLFMLTDCEPVALLTRAALKDALPPLNLPVVVLDEDTFSRQPTHNPDANALNINSSHLAYVIYTSGSTGLPKGVMNQHSGVVNRLLWAKDEYHVTAQDRVLQKTPFSFDVSVWEFFLPLLAGAQLVIARPRGHLDPEYLFDIIARAGITMVHFVPSMLSSFLEHPAIPPPEQEPCRSLRHVLCSGEALPYSLQLRCQARLPHVELHNLYGPTEAAIDVTSWRCRPDRHTGIVPIGRPIANTAMYVLDAQRQPVPTGATGELHIGGVQVARGYLNRPDLTEERFLPDPFSSTAHARMYKTGDLGRYLPDGNLVFLGRNDFQVKIRGFRIELGEIEAQLLAYGGVRAAVVVAREDTPGEKRLVAYLVPDGRTELSASQLRAHLAAALAEYMVPVAYVTLPSLPLTASGKLDRRALPAPAADSYPVQIYEAPLGETERVIAGIWCHLLQRDRVGRQDNFFVIGGHSLLATRLTVRLQEAFDLPVPLLTIFQHPTVCALALVVTEMQLGQFDADEISRASAKFAQLSEEELQHLL